MEQFEQIRRDRDREGVSIRGLAARYGVHRRTVKQALLSPLPPVKGAPVSRPAPKLGAYREVIDGWLLADQSAPRKQRHTAKRIWHASSMSSELMSRSPRFSNARPSRCHRLVHGFRAMRFAVRPPGRVPTGGRRVVRGRVVLLVDEVVYGPVAT